MHDILILSPALTKEKSEQYILSIQLSLDGFSFCICDSISNKFIALKHKPFSYSETAFNQTSTYLKTEEWLNIPYKKVVVLYDLSPSTSVPEVLFDDSKKELYFTKNYKLNLNEIVVADKVDPYKNMTLYGVQESLRMLFYDHFKHPLIRHLNYVKNCYASLSYGNKDTFIRLTIRQSRFSLAAYSGDAMLIENSYSYQNEEEFLYFFLYCFKQLDLDQMTTKVEIDGIVPRHASLVKQMERFIKHVTFTGWPEAFNYAHDFYDLPAHYFTYLYAALLCE